MNTISKSKSNSTVVILGQSTVSATENDDGTVCVTTEYADSGRTYKKTMTPFEWSTHCGWMRAEGGRWVTRG